MYPYSRLPKPLSTQEFYILLALSRDDLHVYALRGAVQNYSLGSVDVPAGRLYPLVNKLYKDGFVEIAGMNPVGKSATPRLHYTISSHGQIRLQEEATRLAHAVKVLESSGFYDNPVPTDIQRLMLEQAS